MRVEQWYREIAADLVNFGYPETTPKMVEDVHNAMAEGNPIPHQIIGKFAQEQLKQRIKALPRKE